MFSRNPQGVTLIELLVSVFIFTILSSAAYLSLDYGRRAKRVGEVEVELQQGARKAMAEMEKDLRESDPSTVTVTSNFKDPKGNEYHQIIALASARGDSAAGAEVGACVDGVNNNACFHVDATGNPQWRSLIVYAFYQTDDGRRELRRYVNYDSAYGTGVHFPFTLTSITSSQLSLRSRGGLNVTFRRDGSDGLSRVLTENIATEDSDNDNALDTGEDDGSTSLPFDNNDGVLNRGADFSLNGRVLTITLFLRKRDVPFSSATRFVVSTLKNSIEMRN